MTDLIRLETHGHVLAIEVCRPAKRNALNLEMARGINAAYTRLSDDPELRVGVVHAAGDHFTGGLDLADVGPALAGVEGLEGLRGLLLTEDDGVDAFGLIGRPCAKPVVVAVQGRCFTWGIELALAAELCVAAEDVVFQQNEVSRGIFALGGATIRMPARFGWGNAMRYLLTGDPFDAAEAHRLGLVQEVVPVGAQLDRAMELAGRIAAQAPLGIAVTLETARLAAAPGQAEAVAAAVAAIPGILGSRDAMEGLVALMERRDPVYEGR